MAKLSNNVGQDTVGLNDFVKRVERLCRYSDLSILLYRNRDGLFLSEITNSLGGKIEDIENALDILVRDEMVEEDRTRRYYVLDDTAAEVFDLNSNDSTITLESRLSELSNKLNLYAITTDEKTKETLGDNITNYLYKTYHKTGKELNQLKNKVESEYKTQRDLRYKSQMLSLYIRQIEDIMYALDVSRPTERQDDGTKIVYRNLKQMLYSDEHYGRDYRLSIEGFFKNCDARLSNQILELYNLFRAWWGKTKVALEEFRCASSALETLIHYNPSNATLREAIENTNQPLPPITRRFGKNDEPEDDDASIDIRERILSLDAVSVDDYNVITSCCASLHYDFVNFRVLEDQDIPEMMTQDAPPVEEKLVIDMDEEFKQFRSSHDSLLVFLSQRYPDLSKKELMSLYLKMALETGDKPMVFNQDFETEMSGEHIDEEYNIITIRNKPTINANE